MPATLSAPQPGELVHVRREHWVVVEVDHTRQSADELTADRLPGQVLVTLMNVSGEDVGEQLRLVWEIEPGHRIVSGEDLPAVAVDRWDDPRRLGTFLDAVRWGSDIERRHTNPAGPGSATFPSPLARG